MIAEWREDIGERKDNPHRLNDILNIVKADDVEYFVENVEFLKMIIILVVEAVGTNEKLAELFRGLFRGYRGLLAGRIDALMEKEEKHDSSLRMADVFLSVLTGSLVLKILDPETIDIVETLERAQALFVGDK